MVARGGRGGVARDAKPLAAAGEEGASREVRGLHESRKKKRKIEMTFL